MQDVLRRGETAFDWDLKKNFEATENVLQTRQNSYTKKGKPKEYQLWNKPAPDLRVQLFDPCPPLRNSREAIQPWKYVASFDGVKDAQKDEGRLQLHSVRLNASRSSATNQVVGEEVGDFRSYVRTTRPWEAKLLSIKDGSRSTGKYQDPRPHDFRQLPHIETLGLPEFDVNSEKDPFNLKFLSKSLDIVSVAGLQIANLACTAHTVPFCVDIIKSQGFLLRLPALRRRLMREHELSMFMDFRENLKLKLEDAKWATSRTPCRLGGTQAWFCQRTRIQRGHLLPPVTDPSTDRLKVLS